MNHVVDGVLHGDCQRCGAGDCECASREAPLTSVRCSLCNEFLCTKARPELWGPRRTCWEVFHNDHELPLHPYHDYTPPTGSAVKRARLDPEMNTDGSAVKRARGRAMSMLAGAGSSGTHMSPAAAKVALARARARQQEGSSSAIKRALNKAREKRRGEKTYGSTKKRLFTKKA